MKALNTWMPLAFAGLLAASSAQAVTIDFTGLDATTDPTVSQVSFWAGDPGAFLDTIVFDDAGNEVLLSGIMDGTDSRGPASGYDTFIGASKSGTMFGSVSFDIASDYNFPSFNDNTVLWVEAYKNGVLAGSTSTGVNHNNFVNLALTLTNGFDKLFIYDDLNSFDLGEAFRIDNFVYTEYQPPCTGPNCNPVPEPSALLLLGIGMAGFAFARKHKSA